jgi:hypothetical protein
MRTIKYYSGACNEQFPLLMATENFAKEESNINRCITIAQTNINKQISTLSFTVFLFDQKLMRNFQYSIPLIKYPLRLSEKSRSERLWTFEVL